MDREIYSKVKREYEIKHDLKLRQAREFETKILNENKSLFKVKKEIDEAAIKSTKLLLGEDIVKREIERENLEIKLKALEEKYEKELAKLGLKKDDFLPKYDCNICCDTGLIKNSDGTKSFCKCFTQRVIDETYNESNMVKLQDENFNTFDTGYYSKKADKEKYGIDKSPLDNILCILDGAKKFCENIDDKNQKDLLFTGNTGLGKTFIANCIADEIIKSGKSVIYQTAPILMDKIMEYKFSSNKNAKNEYTKILNSDLLIIDDLGTETMSNVKFTELFNIINSRLLNNKKMVISTNLSLSELYNLYDERVMSRIIGNFSIYRFVGEDIRLKKRKLN